MHDELKSRLMGLAFVHVDQPWTADQTGVFVSLCSRMARIHRQGLKTYRGFDGNFVKRIGGRPLEHGSGGKAFSLICILWNAKMGEGISGSVGELSFALFPNLLGWRGDVRFHDAGGCTADHIGDG